MKNEFGDDVLDSVRKFAELHMEDCLLLTNYMLPHLGNVLSQQRGIFYEFGTHEPQFPVFKQAENVNKAVTNNLQLERECGDHDDRIKKKGNVAVVSRDNILKRTVKLRDESTESFRCSAKVLDDIESVVNSWSTRQEKLKAVGLSTKETNQLQKENRKLKILSILKQDNGPFTCTEEIEQYMASNIDETVKQKRMKNEIIYARDSTRSRLVN